MICLAKTPVFALALVAAGALGARLAAAETPQDQTGLAKGEAGSAGSAEERLAGAKAKRRSAKKRGAGEGEPSGSDAKQRPSPAQEKSFGSFSLGASLGSFEAPKLSLPKLSEPELSGLELQGKQARPGLRASSGPARQAKLAIEGVELARRFRGAGGSVCKAVDPVAPMVSMHLKAYPGQADPFVTCLLLSSDQAGEWPVAATLRDARGREVANAEGRVRFGTALAAQAYLIEWSGFYASLPGRYRFDFRFGDSAEKTLSVELK